MRCPYSLLEDRLSSATSPPREAGPPSRSLKKEPSHDQGRVKDLSTVSSQSPSFSSSSSCRDSRVDSQNFTLSFFAPPSPPPVSSGISDPPESSQGPIKRPGPSTPTAGPVIASASSCSSFPHSSSSAKSFSRHSAKELPHASSAVLSSSLERDKKVSSSQTLEHPIEKGLSLLLSAHSASAPAASGGALPSMKTTGLYGKETRPTSKTSLSDPSDRKNLPPHCYSARPPPLPSKNYSGEETAEEEQGGLSQLLGRGVSPPRRDVSSCIRGGDKRSATSIHGYGSSTSSSSCHVTVSAEPDERKRSHDLQETKEGRRRVTEDEGEGGYQGLRATSNAPHSPERREGERETERGRRGGGGLEREEGAGGARTGYGFYLTRNHQACHRREDNRHEHRLHFDVTNRRRLEKPAVFSATEKSSGAGGGGGVSSGMYQCSLRSSEENRKEIAGELGRSENVDNHPSSIDGINECKRSSRGSKSSNYLPSSLAPASFGTDTSRFLLPSSSPPPPRLSYQGLGCYASSSSSASSPIHSPSFPLPPSSSCSASSSLSSSSAGLSRLPVSACASRGRDRRESIASSLSIDTAPTVRWSVRTEGRGDDEEVDDEGASKKSGRTNFGGDSGVSGQTAERHYCARAARREDLNFFSDFSLRPSSASSASGEEGGDRGRQIANKSIAPTNFYSPSSSSSVGTSSICPFPWNNQCFASGGPTTSRLPFSSSSSSFPCQRREARCVESHIDADEPASLGRCEAPPSEVLGVSRSVVSAALKKERASGGTERGRSVSRKFEESPPSPSLQGKSSEGAGADRPELNSSSSQDTGPLGCSAKTGEGRRGEGEVASCSVRASELRSKRVEEKENDARAHRRVESQGLPGMKRKVEDEEEEEDGELRRSASTRGRGARGRSLSRVSASRSPATSSAALIPKVSEKKAKRKTQQTSQYDCARSSGGGRTRQRANSGGEGREFHRSRGGERGPYADDIKQKAEALRTEEGSWPGKAVQEEEEERRRSAGGGRGDEKRVSGKEETPAAASLRSFMEDLDTCVAGRSRGQTRREKEAVNINPSPSSLSCQRDQREGQLSSSSSVSSGGSKKKKTTGASAGDDEDERAEIFFGDCEVFRGGREGKGLRPERGDADPFGRQGPVTRKDEADAAAEGQQAEEGQKEGKPFSSSASYTTAVISEKGGAGEEREQGGDSIGQYPSPSSSTVTPASSSPSTSSCSQEKIQETDRHAGTREEAEKVERSESSASLFLASVDDLFHSSQTSSSVGSHSGSSTKERRDKKEETLTSPASCQAKNLSLTAAVGPALPSSSSTSTSVSTSPPSSSSSSPSSFSSSLSSSARSTTTMASVTPQLKEGGGDSQGAGEGAEGSVLKRRLSRHSSAATSNPSSSPYTGDACVSGSLLSHAEERRGGSAESPHKCLVSPSLASCASMSKKSLLQSGLSSYVRLSTPSSSSSASLSDLSSGSRPSVFPPSVLSKHQPSSGMLHSQGLDSQSTQDTTTGLQASRWIAQHTSSPPSHPATSTDTDWSASSQHYRVVSPSQQYVIRRHGSGGRAPSPASSSSSSLSSCIGDPLHAFHTRHNTQWLIGGHPPDHSSRRVYIHPDSPGHHVSPSPSFYYYYTQAQHHPAARGGLFVAPGSYTAPFPSYPRKASLVAETATTVGGTEVTWEGAGGGGEQPHRQGLGGEEGREQENGRRIFSSSSLCSGPLSSTSSRLMGQRKLLSLEEVLLSRHQQERREKKQLKILGWSLLVLFLLCLIRRVRCLSSCLDVYPNATRSSLRN